MLFISLGIKAFINPESAFKRGRKKKDLRVARMSEWSESASCFLLGMIIIPRPDFVSRFCRAFFLSVARYIIQGFFQGFIFFREERRF
jgi:hypothetical protein